MFWNKKDDKDGLPDLPALRIPIVQPPSSDDTDDDDEIVDRHNLPSFPDSPLKKGFSQAAIKDAVTTREIEEAQREDATKKFGTVEMEEWSPSLSPPPTEENYAETKKVTARPLKENAKKQDLFVKIDKFHSAKRALEETKIKLEEIDNLLRKIRETKLREEQELSAWEKELSSIKARVQEVTENIFEKLD